MNDQSPAAPALFAPKQGADAWHEAQRVAFAPVVFQVARGLRDLGVLADLVAARPKPLTTAELLASTGLSRNSLLTLLEAGLSFGFVTGGGDGWFITDTAVFLQRDERTRVNFDFTQDVCWPGMGELPRSLAEDAPHGLAALGDWPTVYEGLSQLAEPARSSWLAFDHFYSDHAFPRAWPLVKATRPRRLLDVGGNTGRFATFAARDDADLQVTILDLPGQIGLAQVALQEAGVADRVSFAGADLLDADVAFPPGQDAVWMSQFLVCFGLDDVLHLLQRAKAALAPGGSVWILDTFWDRQTSEPSTFCLHGLSPYFVAIASGKSRVYPLSELEPVIEAAGLRVDQIHDPLGPSHTLLRCVPAER